MNKYYFFTEYEWQKCVDFKIPIEFYEKGFCEKSNSGLVKFKITGILEYQDEFFVIYPKGMVVPSQEKERILLTNLLLKTLMKYSSTSFLSDEENTWMGKNESSRIYEIAKWLIEDYKQNGLIQYNKKKELKNGSGRIKWAKTIKKNSPIIINGKLYYLDLITSKNDIISDHELTILHTKILNLVSNTYGWMFNFNFNNDYQEGNYSNKYMLYILNKALKSTYIDREIRLLKNLISFLDRRKSKSNLINIYATAYFANIWELVCAEFIGDVKVLHNIVPKPYWIYEDTKTYTSQIPDILINIDNNLIVLDAKYYRIKQGVDKLPGWSDIVKQLFYAMSLKNSSRKVFNAFLFPSSCDEGYKYLGYTSVESKEQDFGKVIAFGLDIQMVLMHYLDKKKVLNKKRVVNQLLFKIVDL